LVQLFNSPLRTASAYYIALPETGAKRVAADFADWAATLLQAK
jgi:hypothetical protein